MSIVPFGERESRAWIALQSPAVELANAVAGTDFVPPGLRNNPPAIMAAILYGDEVGLGPMQSLAKIAVINGRPTLAAEAQRALILAAGHSLWIEESTTTKCTVAGRRRDDEQVSRVSWTMDDAKRAGLAGKPPWRAYPRQMLLARATAELARVIFADAIGGLAATEEVIEDAALIEQNGVEPVETTQTTRRRSRATVTAPQTTSAPEAQTPIEDPPLPGDDLPPVADDETAALVVPEGGPETTPLDAPGTTPMSDPQRRLLMSLFNEHGFSGREHRLAWTTVNLGRHVTTSKDLTSAEASRLIDLLQAMTPSDEP